MAGLKPPRARLAFSGLGLVPPGVVIASEWRPKGTGPRPTPQEVNGYGRVARKPKCRSGRGSAAPAPWG
jgi:S-adenosyl methyltransferase